MAETKDPQKELEISINELEERVDRLRALYEQYFMGFEKLEPAVQRRDVDRRFVTIRKQQIRNTALRFRFNVVTQRFNTYAMYWTRICRQIEDGTYKRHIAKAERRFGDRERERAGSRDREMDFSIDVDLAGFEDEEPDLPPAASPFSEPPAEIAAAVLRARPAATEDRPAPAEARARAPVPPPPETPTAPFRADAPSVPDSEVGPRTPRHVALPPGARAVVLRKSPRGDADVAAPGPPASSRRLPNAPPAAPPHAPPASERQLARPVTAPLIMPTGPKPAPGAKPAQPAMPTPAVPLSPSAAPRGPGPIPHPQPGPAPRPLPSTGTPVTPVSPMVPMAPPGKPPASAPRLAPSLPSGNRPGGPPAKKDPGPQ